MHLENEVRKELRRQRAAAEENPAVAAAFFRAREVEDAEVRKRRRLTAEANERLKIQKDAKAKLDRTTKELNQKKQQVLDMENLLETRHAMRRYTVSMLGQGKRDCGGKTARDMRGEVLDRLARIGTGNDWKWFKMAWDEKMAGEHKENWGGLFAQWAQEVLDKCSGGQLNAFSLLVHSETRRCFDSVPQLLCP